jgi:hypothetical protein
MPASERCLDQLSIMSEVLSLSLCSSPSVMDATQGKQTKAVLIADEVIYFSAASTS